MPKKKDENETAFDALQELLNRDRERDGLPVDPPKKEKKMSCRVEAGRKGGKISSTTKSLSKEQRQKIAKKAAKTRWNKKK